MRMQILDIITKKKLGQPLTREEITFFARGAADKTCLLYTSPSPRDS